MTPSLHPAIATLSAAAIALGGCSSLEIPSAAPSCQPSQALALVISVHQGGSAPSVPAAAVCYLDTALRTGEPISIVTAEGMPRVIMRSATWTLNDGQPESANPQAYGDDLTTARSAVLTTIHNASATSDHDDLLAAIAMASDQSHQDPGQAAHILVIDDGLSDTGAVSLAQPGMTAANPDEVADFVRTHGGCPTSLTGVSVTMYGAGYGVDPQPALSTAQITRIGQIWQKTIAACGGTSTSYPVRAPIPAPPPRTP